MTIARDLEAAIAVLTAVRVILAQDPAHGRAWTTLTTVQAALEDCRLRIAEIEASPVPAHWLPQRAPESAEVTGGQVVVLAQVRQARAVARVVRL